MIANKISPLSARFHTATTMTPALLSDAVDFRLLRARNPWSRRTNRFSGVRPRLKQVALWSTCTRTSRNRYAKKGDTTGFAPVFDGRQNSLCRVTAIPNGTTCFSDSSQTSEAVDYVSSHPRCECGSRSYRGVSGSHSFVLDPLLRLIDLVHNCVGALTRGPAVTVEISKGFWVVGDHGIKVEGLWVTKIGVWNWDGSR